MNIFLLDEDPIVAAQMQCNKHVVKMILETAQILCSSFNAGNAPYRRTHYNHPCCIWARSSRENYEWLIKHGKALAEEYTKRYNKRHKSLDVIYWCHSNISKISFPLKGLTPFALCMPEKYIEKCPIQSYRNFYIGEKLEFCVWPKDKTPYWIKYE